MAPPAAPIFQLLLEDLDWHPGASCLPPVSPLTIYGKHVLISFFNHAQCGLDAAHVLAMAWMSLE